LHPLIFSREDPQFLHCRIPELYSSCTSVVASCSFVISTVKWCSIYWISNAHGMPFRLCQISWREGKWSSDLSHRPVWSTTHKQSTSCGFRMEKAIWKEMIEAMLHDFPESPLVWSNLESTIMCFSLEDFGGNRVKYTFASRLWYRCA
jgi:hypothetical protein